MADKFPYTLEEPATLLYSSITQKSAPKGVAGAAEKFSGTFGIGEKDFKLLLPIMVQAITGECGSFSGKPEDYYLACMSGRMAASRVRQKAELDAKALEGKGETDAAFKVRERAEKRATAYEGYAGILSASSQFDVTLARLDNGKIVDIVEPHAIAQAGKDLFYSGAKVVPRVAIQGFRRKTLDAKDGCTAFLQNCLFIAKGPKLDLGGGGPNNSEVFSGFANYSDYDPLAMAPGGDSDFAAFAGNGAGAAGASSPASPAVSPSSAPPPPVSGPARPTDPGHIHDNGDGTEQYWNGSAWDGGKHPKPGANPPPPPGAGAVVSTVGADAPQW
jgi:hypothetical protein